MIGKRAAARAALALALAAAAVVGWKLLQVGWPAVLYPGLSRYPVRGIDVSNHQGDIDWAAVKGEGLAFAYIKASEGGDFRDKRFEQNWRGAAEAGLHAGAYHFFTFCKEGAAQADNFLGALAAAGGPMLPPAVDLEFRGNCKRRPTNDELREELRDFVGRVERRVGQPLIYYVTPEFMWAYADAMPERQEIWIRSVFFKPGKTFGHPWVYWQYASRGSVAGINGPVDLDAFHGSRADWSSYLERRLVR